MTFHGILFRTGAGAARDERLPAPACFTDLNLDQIVAAVTAGREEYGLDAFFHWPLRDVDDIAFRHEVMGDLERPRLFDDIRAFAASMRASRAHLAQAAELRDGRQTARWFLDAVDTYCDAVGRLAGDLSSAPLASRGMRAFRDRVRDYVASGPFVALRRQAKALSTDLAAIRYTVLINSPRVQVRRHDGEPDYGADVEATFEKFRQGAVTDYAFNFGDAAELNPVEAAILDQVVKLYPEEFARLEDFVREHQDFADPLIVTFDREVQFYVAYLEYLAPFRDAGLDFCYPRVTRTTKEVYDERGFDLALAGKLLRENAVPVCNDVRLGGRERIIVVSGPNQGGKTTFARTFGQLHYLASLGCPVPGTRAQLFLFDQIFTHFEREEHVASLRGKLQDDLVRIHGILERATPHSIVIMNEVFTSTTFRDAGVLSRRIAARLTALDALCVWVTFLDELASLGPQTVSMVSTVAPGNPARRTFRILRRPADGLAYALSIAEKYRLTYALSKERLGS